MRATSLLANSRPWACSDAGQKPVTDGWQRQPRRTMPAQGLEFADKLVARMARSVERELASVPAREEPSRGTRPTRSAARQTVNSPSSQPRFERSPGGDRAPDPRVRLDTRSRRRDFGLHACTRRRHNLRRGQRHCDSDLLLQNAHAAAEEATEPRSSKSIRQCRRRRVASPAAGRVGVARCGGGGGCRSPSSRA